ncbi:ECU10_0355 [Encephalitozoon cuniculi GB-M1]|uniref:ECU10_0355 protein n=1 Tax=Encephalitozoon cuniculi (strain GB-M1) TaxID=284813 RepID=I7L8M2_ENCCU|nr:uncharacterized protein ECU10_0355 [Encephalitozoon cuniculi GB-M1]CCI73987.1 ECU10_0355 [Encephalitozoon cuniculi GB-M1]
MARKIANELQEYMNEIEKIIESDKTPRERINSKRRKMQRLGGHVKKHPTPLNRILERIERRKASVIAERERMESMGISKKKKRAR